MAGNQCAYGRGELARGMVAPAVWTHDRAATHGYLDGAAEPQYIDDDNHACIATCTLGALCSPIEAGVETVLIRHLQL